MELDTNIMQTKTVINIIGVLRKVEQELVLNDNKQQVAQIIDSHEIAMSLASNHTK